MAPACFSTATSSSRRELSGPRMSCRAQRPQWRVDGKLQRCKQGWCWPMAHLQHGPCSLGLVSGLLSGGDGGLVLAAVHAGCGHIQHLPSLGGLCLCQALLGELLTLRTAVSLVSGSTSRRKCRGQRHGLTAAAVPPGEHPGVPRQRTGGSPALTVHPVGSPSRHTSAPRPPP